ncbi:MAG TPA: substrate-binding domain-containing protein [Acidimicrobiales bacterium]
MRLAQRRYVRLLALPLALALIAAACGDDDTAAGGDGGGSGAASDGDEASGTIDVSGSSTVAPVTTRVAEQFEEVAPDVQVNVDGPGTGDGFALFCDGETDISDASRPITAEEVETCEANGIEYIELKIAIDGLSVLTNPANDTECLSFADMYALVGPESQGFATWSDASELAAELGSDTELPDASLDITAPGEESGTYDSFLEIVLEDIAEERDQEPVSRPDYQSSADDNVIIQGIEGSDSSFGWVGYAYAIEAGDAVKQLAVSEEPGGECIAPTEETVADGSYPIARDLYIYPNVERLEENPALVEFLDYYLSDEGLAAVGDVGYIDLPSDAIAETRDVWEARETGTRDGG